MSVNGGVSTVLSTSRALTANCFSGSSCSKSTRFTSPPGLVPPRLEVGDDDDDDGMGVRLLLSKPPHSTVMGSHPGWIWMDGWGASEAAMEQISP